MSATPPASARSSRLAPSKRPETRRPARRREATPPPNYRRRTPEATDLYDALRRHLADFLERCESAAGGESAGLPAHVRGELERYLDCGILKHGFIRVWCPACRDDLLVAFSCHGRGICPSCGARRMADTAARWVEHVLADVPWRQWVLSVPFALRIRLAWDPALLTEALGCFQAAVGCRLRRLARQRGIRRAMHGAATVVQRYGSALNLNVHLHSLVADGVWRETADGAVRFEPLCLRDEDVAAVVRSFDRKFGRVLENRGITDGYIGLVGADDGSGAESGEEDDAGGEPERERQVELSLLAASVHLRVAMGPRAGTPVRRIKLPGSGAVAGGARRRPRKAMHATWAGYDLHANVRISAGDRRGLEQLARYVLRPAICSERVTRDPDGDYRVELRRPWSDGTIALRYAPMELMEKLAALVPMPRKNLIRYHGVLAPAAKWRAAVVPRGQPGAEGSGRQEESLRPAVPRDRIPWAELLHRVFKVDVLRCEGCGGRREILAEVTSPAVIRRILAWLGLDEDARGPARVRGPPTGEERSRVRDERP